MEEDKRQLIGSPSRDSFKQAHKEFMPGAFYACDLDFILVAKNPEGIIAFLDYKKFADKVSFSEVLAYNELVKTHPVFVIKSQNPRTAPFYIFEYKGGDWRPEPPITDLIEIQKCSSWAELIKWERNLRIGDLTYARS